MIVKLRDPKVHYEHTIFVPYEDIQDIDFCIVHGIEGCEVTFKSDLEPFKSGFSAQLMMAEINAQLPNSQPPVQYIPYNPLPTHYTQPHPEWDFGKVTCEGTSPIFFPYNTTTQASGEINTGDISFNAGGMGVNPRREGDSTTMDEGMSDS